MKFSLPWTEVLLTLPSAFLAGGIFGVVSPTYLAASAQAFSKAHLTFLLYPSVQTVIVLVCGALLVGGLATGLRRHLDMTSLLFAFVGLALQITSLMFFHIPILLITGGFCVLFSSLWNLFKTRVEWKKPPVLPDLSDFQDGNTTTV
jgi:hypothetical protein